MGEPTFRNADKEGFDIRANRQIRIPSNGPVSDGEGETLARQVWPIILYHTTLTKSTDVKILPYSAVQLNNRPWSYGRVFV